MYCKTEGEKTITSSKTRVGKGQGHISEEYVIVLRWGAYVVEISSADESSTAQIGQRLFRIGMRA